MWATIILRWVVTVTLHIEMLSVMLFEPSLWHIKPYWLELKSIFFFTRGMPSPIFLLALGLLSVIFFIIRGIAKKAFKDSI